MKIITILILSATIFFASCGPSPKQAAKYNSAVTVLEKRVIKVIDSLDRSYKTFDTILIYTALLHAEEITKKNKDILIKRLPPIGRDSSLYKAEYKFFNTILALLKEQYYKMYRLQCIPSEKYTDKEEKYYLKIRNKKDEIIQTAFDKFRKTQSEFADRYHIKLKNKESDIDF